MYIETNGSLLFLQFQYLTVVHTQKTNVNRFFETLLDETYDVNNVSNYAKNIYWLAQYTVDNPGK